MKNGLGLALLSVTLLLSGCTPKSETKSFLSPSKMQKVNTEQKLKQLLKKGNDHRSIRFASNMWTAEDATDTAAPGMEENATGEEKRDFVGTNLQDAAVDESDIIKTNGNKVFYISNATNKFLVFDVLEDHSIVKSQEIIEQNAYLQEMYLLEDYIVVLGSQQRGGMVGYDYFYPYYSGSALFVYDINTLEKVYSLELNYSMTTTRVIDRALYIVGHKDLYWQNDNVMPQQKENDDEVETMSYGDIYYNEETLGYSLTILGGLYLDSDPEMISYSDEGYLASSYGHKNVYVNENNLYISDSTYYYDKTNAYTSLTLSQFSLDNEHAKPVYIGSGTLKGAALNQFAMDENDGHLRIATTDNEARWMTNIMGEAIWETYKSTITNYLYILKMDKEAEAFELVGYIDEGLGKPNETIRSVRFSGDKGYIVTFLQTDPLYVIDLQDPKNPVVTDAIVLPGFDTYQHPWSKNSLIGLGYNATETGMTTGIKISAYNTTSGSASELQTVDVAMRENSINEYRYVYSEALSNHKAILVSPAHNIFGFPIYAHSYTWSNNYGESKTYSEYVIYKINFDNEEPISELVRITYEDSGYYYNQIRRALLIEGVVYTFSGNSVATFDIANNVVTKDVVSF